MPCGRHSITPHMVYLLKRHWCDLVCVQSISVTPQPQASTIHVGTHPVRSATTCKRSASTALAGTHNPVDTDPRAGTCPFPKPRALVLTLVNPNLTGTVTLIQQTAISCIINIVFLSFSGIQAQRAGTVLTSSRLPVESSMRLFNKKPVIIFRTSLISSLRTLATRTSLSCSTRTPLSLALWCLPSGKTPQAKVRWVWFYSSFEVSCDAHLFLDH